MRVGKIITFLSNDTRMSGSLALTVLPKHVGIFADLLEV